MATNDVTAAVEDRSQSVSWNEYPSPELNVRRAGDRAIGRDRTSGGEATLAIRGYIFQCRVLGGRGESGATQ